MSTSSGKAKEIEQDWDIYWADKVGRLFGAFGAFGAMGRLGSSWDCPDSSDSELGLIS